MAPALLFIDSLYPFSDTMPVTRLNMAKSQCFLDNKSKCKRQQLRFILKPISFTMFLRPEQASKLNFVLIKDLELQHVQSARLADIFTPFKNSGVLTFIHADGSNQPDVI